MKIKEKAVSEKLIIAGMHLSQTGFASILREDYGYRISYSEK